MSNSTATPWTIAHQAPLSMGFSRQEYWSGFAISSSRGSSWPRDRSYVFYIGRWVLYHWATRETQHHSGTTTLSYVSRRLLAPVTQGLYWAALSPKNSLTHYLTVLSLQISAQTSLSQKIFPLTFTMTEFSLYTLLAQNIFSGPSSGCLLCDSPGRKLMLEGT